MYFINIRLNNIYTFRLKYNRLYKFVICVDFLIVYI